MLARLSEACLGGLLGMCLDEFSIEEPVSMVRLVLNCDF